MKPILRMLDIRLSPLGTPTASASSMQIQHSVPCAMPRNFIIGLSLERMPEHDAGKSVNAQEFERIQFVKSLSAAQLFVTGVRILTLDTRAEPPQNRGWRED